MTPLQWKRLFYRILIWAAILGLALLLVAVGAATWRVATRGMEAKALHEGAQKNLDELYARKTAVDTELQNLNTDRGIEEEIRGRFQLWKPGE
jgi:cell division protein FtsB